MKIIKLYSVLLLVVLVTNGQSVFAKKIYRWIDENGIMQLSDRLPPDQVTHRREALNKNAQTIKVTEKAKTKRQLEKEARLEKLRKQQAALIAKQEASDKVLLITFGNLEDMELALKRKLEFHDGQKKVVLGNMNRLEQQLQLQQKKAAQFERDGVNVPEEILKNISVTKEQIKLALIEIDKQLQNKEKTRKAFEVDIARYAFLTQTTISQKRDPKRKKTKNLKESELGIYVCQSPSLCNQAWDYAKTFVRTYSTTELDIETEHLIMTQKPVQKSDVGLSVSRMNLDNGKQQFFLDILCHPSLIGEKLCKDPEIRIIQQLFNGYIQSTLVSKL